MKRLVKFHNIPKAMWKWNWTITLPLYKNNYSITSHWYLQSNQNFKSQNLLFIINNSINRVLLFDWPAKQTVHSQRHLMEILRAHFSINQAHYCSYKLFVGLPHFWWSCFINSSNANMSSLINYILLFVSFEGKK